MLAWAVCVQTNVLGVQHLRRECRRALLRWRHETVWVRHACLQAARPFLRHLSCRLRCGCAAWRLPGASGPSCGLPRPLLLVWPEPAALPADASQQRLRRDARPPSQIAPASEGDLTRGVAFNNMQLLQDLLSASAALPCGHGSGARRTLESLPRNRAHCCATGQHRVAAAFSYDGIASFCFQLDWRAGESRRRLQHCNPPAPAAALRPCSM